MDDLTPTADEAPARSDGIPPEDVHLGSGDALPDTQGTDPLDAELGEDGQGDVLAEDDPARADEGPTDLRVTDDSSEVDGGL